MPTYLAPGVYTEEIPSGSRPIEGVSTSTAAFLGYATRGPLLGNMSINKILDEAAPISKFEDYVSDYGGIRDMGDSEKGDPMGNAVRAFFLNGGKKAFIFRLADGSPAAATTILRHPTDPTNVLVVEAVNPGAWADNLTVSLEVMDSNAALDDRFYNLVVKEKVHGRDDPVERETVSRISLRLAADNEQLKVGGPAANPEYTQLKVQRQSNFVQISTKPFDSNNSDHTDAVVEFHCGVLTSGQISVAELSDWLGDGALPADDDGLKDKTLNLEFVQSGPNATSDITFANDLSDFTLQNICDIIQGAVSAGTNVAIKKDFTCVVDGSKLVLTSGKAGDATEIKATGDAARMLWLDTTAPPEAQRAVSKTGAHNFQGPDGLQAGLSGGADGAEPGPAAYGKIFTAMEKMPNISIICLPGAEWTTGPSNERAIVQSALSHAEKMKNRMVIVDPPPDKELDSESEVNGLGMSTSSYAVVYYPWVQVLNPFYDAEKTPGKPKLQLVSPSGYAAGIWAGTDGTRGVWKAPAGLQAALRGLQKAQYVVETPDQETLNPLGINCFRRIISDLNVWGSRTRSTQTDPEWRYVPVRRTAIMIRESVRRGIQWAVFEPNDHRLWSSLRLNVEAFMDTLYNQGAFQGEKASDAYFVRCGLDDTMTQADIDAGRVIVTIGFAPLKPAEFVIIRLMQKVAQD